MECPYCNAENRDGVRFCSNCGRPLNPTSTATATSTGSGSASITSRSLTPGSRLQGGRYIIKKILGQGGMGAALLATDIRLDSKPVVIKELISDNTDPARLQEDVRNFKREVATLAHLDHPLIPNVTDHFQEGSRYFMVQEYVEGENLEERMDRLNSPMKERDALGYASEVLDILDYLAQETPPIVHRDIKPANIIIGNKDKRAHLVDFGIARADVTRNAQRKQTSALGTPGYAPPEQYQGNADPRSDLYALAATLHHLLTNRDPRNHPPFTYPPVRTLNPQLSPEIERILNRALTNEINSRYQSAAAMKQDIDDLLLKRFGVSSTLSNYTLGTSGPMAAVGATNAPTLYPQASRQSPPSSPPPASPYPPARGQQQSPPRQRPPYPAPVGMGGRPPQQQRKNSYVGLSFLLLLLVVVVIAAALFVIPYFRNRASTGGQGGTSTTTPAATPTTILTNGIGPIKAPDGETIGVSDGTVAFDTNRPDGNFKTQAANDLKAGNVNGAISAWQSALQLDTNDAETLIYQEDQHVKSSGSPYITFVIGTMLTGTNAGVGRDDLQGAYVIQKEYNDGFKLNGVLVRLLVANSGNEATYAATVANQIVQASHSDSTIVGVMGWPYSSRTLPAVDVLNAAHIPIVSQTASTDLLTGRSKYFFRVAASNLREAIVGAKYAEQNLHAKNVALFVDPTDAYSNSLAADFKQQFVVADGNTIVATEQYTVGKPETITAPLQDALNHNPDLIYFSGYSYDVSTLLVNLPTSGQFASLQVLGGDALYELGGYSASARAGFNRLRFTAFAYPDEWDNLGLTSQKPNFFTEYPTAFDPNGKHTGGPYGYTRADNDVILSYDAMLALLNGSNIALATNKNFTASDLQKALTQITGTKAIQGISGQIAFGSDGNPINKAIVVLYVAPGGFIKFNSVEGCFLVGHC